jgi:hypothetical protein
MTSIRSWTGSFRYLERSDACDNPLKTKMDGLDALQIAIMLSRDNLIYSSAIDSKSRMYSLWLHLVVSRFQETCFPLKMSQYTSRLNSHRSFLTFEVGNKTIECLSIILKIWQARCISDMISLHFTGIN